jgi:hypothetical protein
MPANTHNSRLCATDATGADFLEATISADIAR